MQLATVEAGKERVGWIVETIHRILEGLRLAKRS